MSSVKKELVSGVMYTGAAKYAGIVVALGVTAVLARMLPPEDFGPIAVATVIITFFNVFSDWGIGSGCNTEQTTDQTGPRRDILVYHVGRNSGSRYFLLQFVVHSRILRNGSPASVMPASVAQPAVRTFEHCPQVCCSKKKDSAL